MAVISTSVKSISITLCHDPLQDAVWVGAKTGNGCILVGYVHGQNDFWTKVNEWFLLLSYQIPCWLLDITMPWSIKVHVFRSQLLALFCLKLYFKSVESSTLMIHHGSEMFSNWCLGQPKTSKTHLKLVHLNVIICQVTVRSRCPTWIAARYQPQGFIS